jgi:hypothetical protein
MLQFEYNWWGHPLGPYHPSLNPSGAGDTVNINPCPYLTASSSASPPIPPIDLRISHVWEDAITLSWLPSQIVDLAGYKIYFDDDSSGFPYAYVVDVGMNTEGTISNLLTGVTYFIAVTCQDHSGEESWYSKEIQAIPGASEVTDASLNEPLNLSALYQNYPNPFNQNTHIRYTIPRDGHVRLKIYNLMGQEVVTLVDAYLPAGAFMATWNGRNSRGKEVSTGMYVCRMETGDRRQTRKLLLLK